MQVWIFNLKPIKIVASEDKSWVKAGFLVSSAGTAGHLVLNGRMLK